MIDRNKSNLKIKQRQKKVKQKLNIIKQRKLKQKNDLTDVKIIFGLDNGSSGTISCIIPEYNYISFQCTPIFQYLDYTKEIQYINRINHFELKKWFENQLKIAKEFYKNEIKAIVILERPMVNPQRFKQSKSALRAYEATLIILELLKLNYIVLDSKQWQHYFFGKNTSQIDLKYESMKLGLLTLEKIYNKDKMEFQEMKKCMIEHGDGDSLLICRYAKEQLIK